MDSIKCEDCIHGDLCKYRMGSAATLKREFGSFKQRVNYPFAAEIICQCFREMPVTTRQWGAPGEVYQKPTKEHETYTTNNTKKGG